MHLVKYLDLLKWDDVQVSAPGEPLPSLRPFIFIIKMAGSLIVSLNDMLQRFRKGEGRYRFVLVNQHFLFFFGVYAPFPRREPWAMRRTLSL